MKFRSYEIDATVSLFHFQTFPSSTREGLARSMHIDDKDARFWVINIAKNSKRNSAKVTAK